MATDRLETTAKEAHENSIKLLVLIWNNYEATEMGEGNREGRKAISIEQKQIEPSFDFSCGAMFLKSLVASLREERAAPAQKTKMQTESN